MLTVISVGWVFWMKWSMSNFSFVYCRWSDLWFLYSWVWISVSLLPVLCLMLQIKHLVRNKQHLFCYSVFNLTFNKMFNFISLQNVKTLIQIQPCTRAYFIKRWTIHYIFLCFWNPSNMHSLEVKKIMSFNK